MSKLIIINLLIGIGLGYSLHRSRFCFAACFRDFLLFRDTGLLKALLISLTISTFLFSLVQYYYYFNGNEIPGLFYSTGLYTVLGGILFGIGMVLAGGCVCSIFLRLGEGFKLFGFVFAGLMLGSMVGAYQYPWWEANFLWIEPLFLGKVLTWPFALFLQLLVLGLGIKLFSERGKEREHASL